MTAFASKTISGVTIRVQSKLEAGDTLENSDLVIGGEPSDGQASVTVNSERCSISSAKFTSYVDKTLKIGDEVRVRVRIEPDTADEYAFKGSYSSSNITVSGGEFVSVSKSSGGLVVNLKLKPVKGTYDPPTDAEWKDNERGHAKWKAPDYSSGHYDVILRRNGSNVVEKDDVNSTGYNFYPYMTKAGTYTFRVRTVPHSDTSKSYGKVSEWTESDEYYLDADHVSNGSGQTDGTENGTQNGTAGWVKSEGKWYYKYPDGSYKKGGWEKVNDKWYLFGNSGIMMTGWQSIASGTYFLSDSGDMMTGWQHLDNNWYYFNADLSSPTEGALLKNMLVTTSDGRYYYLGDKGQMATGWTKVNGNWSYFDPQTGVMARNTTIDTFYVDGNGVWQSQK